MLLEGEDQCRLLGRSRRVAGEIFSGTSVAYLRIVFPAWFFSSFSAALSGRTAELNAIKA